jgi:hypothetical protein
MFDSSIFNLLQKDYKSFVNVDFNGIIPLKKEDFPLPTFINQQNYKEMFEIPNPI